MDEQLKRRLLGAGIVTILAAVIIPYFFEDKAPKTSNELPLPQDNKELALPKAEQPVAEKAPAETGRQAPYGAKKREYTVVPLEEPQAKLAPASAPAGDEEAEPVADEATPAPTRPSRAPVISDPTAPPPKSIPTPKLQHPMTDVPPARVAAAPQDAPKPQPKKPEPVKPVKPVVPSQAPAAPAKKAVNTPEPEKKSSPAPASAPAAKSSAPSSYLVQAGTFSDESNAKNLVEKLKKRNLPVRLQVVEGLNGKVYRVTVGPNLDHARAEQIQKQLSEQDGVRGLILQGH
jgi:DedD protein